MMDNTLKIYNNKNGDTKPLVFLGGGFLQEFNTTTNKKIFSLLQENYDVYGLDNIGHGTEKDSQFTIANHKLKLINLMQSTDKPIHLVFNSLPGIFTVHALKDLLSDEDTKELISQRIKSLTLLAPATNSLGALDDDFATNRNVMTQFFYKYKRSKKYILNPILHHVKGVNADLNMIYDWSKDNRRFIENMKTIIRLAYTIPTHIIFNTGDKAVLTQDSYSDREILEILEILAKRAYLTLGYTYTNQNRHAVYLQDEFVNSSIGDKNSSQIIGDAIKQFIDNNNK